MKSYINSLSFFKFITLLLPMCHFVLYILKKLTLSHIILNVNKPKKEGL